MNPTTEGIPIYVAIVEAFIQRFNRANHTLGELKSCWMLVEKGKSMGIRMRLEVENGRPVAVSSNVYFLKKRRNGGNGVPKFCAQDIGVFTGSMPEYFAKRHSRAGIATFAFTTPTDTILLKSLREKEEVG